MLHMQTKEDGLQIVGLMDRWTDALKRCVNELMDGWMTGWLVGWMTGWMDRCTDGWRDG